jgi:hypothetical protein
MAQILSVKESAGRFYATLMPVLGLLRRPHGPRLSGGRDCATSCAALPIRFGCTLQAVRSRRALLEARSAWCARKAVKSQVRRRDRSLCRRARAQSPPSAKADSVRADFVFLYLLECDAHQIREPRLRQAEFLAAQTNMYSERNIEWMRLIFCCLARHSRPLKYWEPVSMRTRPVHAWRNRRPRYSRSCRRCCSRGAPPPAAARKGLEGHWSAPIALRNVARRRSLHASMAREERTDTIFGGSHTTLRRSNNAPARRPCFLRACTLEAVREARLRGMVHARHRAPYCRRSNLGRAITGSVLLWATLAACAVLCALHIVLAWAIAHKAWIARIIEGVAVELGREGRMDTWRANDTGFRKTMSRKRCARGIEDVRGTKRIVLEASGEITVVKANA